MFHQPFFGFIEEKFILRCGWTWRNQIINTENKFLCYFGDDCLFEILEFIRFTFRDRHQISFLTLIKFRRINQLLFPLKSLQNIRISDDFRGSGCYLIRLNLINIGSEIWSRSLSGFGRTSTFTVGFDVIIIRRLPNSRVLLVSSWLLEAPDEQS